MSTSLVYRSARVYETAMLALYGPHYPARYRALARLVAPGAHVVDVCCGPGVLYTRFLEHQGVRYTALDVNHGFIERLRKRGIDARRWDVRDGRAFPYGDHLIMQASLYHFKANADEVVDRMLASARISVIIAEPVRNLATSRFGSVPARRFSDPGTGEHQQRYVEASLDEFMERYTSRLRERFLIPGGREKVYVLEGGMMRPPPLPSGPPH